jgi:hypothetical protein
MSERGGFMFTELTEELLDLTITEKGYGRALYAANDEGGGGTCSGICSVVVCTFLCHLCW